MRRSVVQWRGLAVPKIRPTVRYRPTADGGENGMHWNVERCFWENIFSNDRRLDSRQRAVTWSQERWLRYPMLSDIASDQTIGSAYSWLCQQCRQWPANSDVWDLRLRWTAVKQTLQRDLLESRFYFEPMSRITKCNGEIIQVWSSRDALVLKALSTVLAKHLPVSSHCAHAKRTWSCVK